MNILFVSPRLAMAFCAAFLLLSCAPFRATAPNGFAAYEEEDKSIYRAISPDGMLYRVSKYEQEAQASPEFWNEAFLLKMKNANYKIEDTLNVQIGGKPAIAYLFSFAGNVEADLYMVAAAPLKSKVIVVEATGTSEQWKSRKEDILKAISEIEL